MNDVKRKRKGRIQKWSRLWQQLTAPEVILRLTMWYPPLFFACSYLFFAACLIRTSGRPMQALRQVLNAAASSV